MPLKLLQWNIWYKEEISNITKTLIDIDADIICIQELTLFHPDHNKNIDTIKYLTETLGFNYFFKPVHVDPQNTFGNIIISKYPIKKTNFYFIKEPAETIVNFSDQGRLYIECVLNVFGKELTVATTHMSYTDGFEPTESKKQETDNLITILKQKKDNFIFTGDLNAQPDSYTINEIEKVLVNCGPDMNQKTWTTKPFSHNGFTANTLDWRLDYCYSTKDIKIESSEIINTEYSDHLPILIKFSI